MKTIVASTLWFALAAVAAAAGVRDIGDHKQLFIDERFLAESHGISLRMNPPVKQGMVIHGTNTWENGIVGSYGTVLEDGGKYRLWYMATPATAVENSLTTYRLCYAESLDGRHWTKPNLGINEWEGSRANNIVMAAAVESAGVLIDPKAAAAERYKLVACLRHPSPAGRDDAPDGDGIYMYTSADGLRWTLHPRRVFPFLPDSLNIAFYDGRLGKFLAYVRTWNPNRRVGVVVIDDIMAPWPYDKTVARSPRNHFTPPTREVPDAFGTDAGDPPNLDHYTSATVEYPWADDAYLMFPSAYRHFPEPPEGLRRNDGTLDIQMAVSRDGLKFHRLVRAPYIGLGEEGSRDSRRTYMICGILRRGPDVYQYYAGHYKTHAGYEDPEVKRDCGGIYLVRQRLDGFVSAEADESGGWFVTPPLRFRGKRLVLNLDAGGTGEARVELQTAGGQPIPGHAFSDSDAIILNDTARTVTWRHGQSDVGAAAGQTARLAVRLRSARLYSFQFTD